VARWEKDDVAQHERARALFDALTPAPSKR